LAEGVSLHRSNAMINYDISWNPTKILQRVGRINRVGSKFDESLSTTFSRLQQQKVSLDLKKMLFPKFNISIICLEKTQNI
jgi:superfamily II DNA/RNA helicase